MLHYSKLNNDSVFTDAGNWDSKTNIITSRIVSDRSMAIKSNTKIRVIIY